MLQNSLQTTLHRAKARAKSNDRLYNFVYDVLNAAEFTDLAEHERMLADSVRVDAYDAAIRKHVSAGDVVVDLGTGTGLLAILAARQGATVHAIDHTEFVSVAERAAEHNGVSDVEFHQIHSRDFTPPEPVDVVVHEQFGDDLFDENLLENVLDLKRRVLKPGGTVLPGRFELFLEPVALDDACRVPFLPEMSVAGVDFDFLGDDGIADRYRPTGYRRRTIDRDAFDAFLSDPEPLLSVDLNRLVSADEIPQSLSASREVVEPGVMDGLCLFFGVVFDDEIRFSTSPTTPRTHWTNRLLRTSPEAYERGDVVSYTVSFGDVENTGTWSVTVG